jgi:HAD superfamily hydrolase (TIGR01509 family)
MRKSQILDKPMYLFLDIHGVLTDGKERKRCLVVMENKYGMNYERHNELWNAHVGKLDTGLERASEYVKSVNATFHTKISVAEYFKIFTSQIVINRTLFKTLQKTKLHRIYIVSDNFLPIPTNLNKIFGAQFRRWKKIYSFRYGVVKSKGLLKKAIAITGIDPRQCIFIDDNEKNVRVAKKIGIDGIVFRTNRELFRDFKARKVLISGMIPL